MGIRLGAECGAHRRSGADADTAMPSAFGVGVVALGMPDQASRRVGDRHGKGLWSGRTAQSLEVRIRTGYDGVRNDVSLQRGEGRGGVTTARFKEGLWSEPSGIAHY
jgi:hypothetical protein